jgi:uncharacterized protein
LINLWRQHESSSHQEQSEHLDPSCKLEGIVRSFHSGELEVQAQAGVTFAALGPVFADTITARARSFLEAQSFLIAASVDARGQPWASLLTGPAGFATAPGDHTISIAVNPTAGDPLEHGLVPGAAIGLIVIEPATRRRHRINGRIEPRRPDQANPDLASPDQVGFKFRIEQAYGNCPQYIQARTLETVEGARQDATPQVYRAPALTTTQRDWIVQADTFFIASSHPEGGADASHRGGKPGFVRVIDHTHLEFPDYSGNKMFNTLGNIRATGRMGLLFLDFEHGRTLQLTGRVEVIWDANVIAQYPDAERVIRFELEVAIETIDGHGLRWRFLDAWQGNPEVGLSQDQQGLR